MRSSLHRLFVVVPRAAAIALLATTFAAPSVEAQNNTPAPLRALEDAIESSTDAVMLPTSQPGTLTFRACPEPCKLRSLQVTGQSTFFIGATQVTLADFNAHVRRSGPLFLMVFREPNGANVTRLTVSGQMQ